MVIGEKYEIQSLMNNQMKYIKTKKGYNSQPIYILQISSVCIKGGEKLSRSEHYSIEDEHLHA
jgi:hypothetical protein